MHVFNTILPYALAVAGYAFHIATVRTQLKRHQKILRVIANAAVSAKPFVNDITTLGQEAEESADTDV